MKNKHLYQFFEPGQILFAALAEDEVVSCLYMGLSENGNPVIRYVGKSFPVKQIVIHPDALYYNYREALLYSRVQLSEKELTLYYQPDNTGIWLSDSSRGIKILDYNENGKFKRELDIVFPNYRINCFAILTTKFEKDNSEKTIDGRVLGMIYQTDMLSSEVSNQQVQSCFFLNKITKTTFKYILN